VQAREILRIQKRMEEIYSFHTGKSEEEVRKDLSRDFWMAPRRRSTTASSIRSLASRSAPKCR